MDYLELAKEQFFDLKEDVLDEDRHCLGAENEKKYEVDGVRFTIKIEGFWEKSNWFDFVVIDEHGTIIKSGTAVL